MQNKSLLRDAANSFTATPSDDAWQKINHLLQEDKMAKKLNVYKLTSIAAIFLSVICVVTVIQTNKEELLPTPYETNDLFSLQMTESPSVGIYEYQKMVNLNNAYMKNKSKKMF